jgi:hypothetical protein
MARDAPIEHAAAKIPATMPGVRGTARSDVTTSVGVGPRQHADAEA